MSARGDAVSRSDSRRDQRQATDPAASAWVAASAGTGKTTVLADRVLRLLLAGTPPARLLCLTFTKAAAAEMANRVAGVLGEWTGLADDLLAERLAALTGETAAGDLLERARRLFAQVIDAPGGLKIETIHAFCQSLLRRFPLEAGIAPHFEAMDERSAIELLETARDEVLLRAREDRDPALAAALATVTGHVQEGEFRDLMGELAKDRGRLAQLLAQRGGLAGAVTALYRRLGLAEGEGVDAVLAAGLDDDACDVAALRRAAAALAAGSAQDRERARLIADWLADPARRRERFDGYRSAFFTKEGAIRTRLATKPVLDAAPATAEALRGEAERLARLGERICAAITAEASAALIRLGAAVLESYERHKAQATLLDYDDLVLQARALLERRGADWVLYKLDQGIDHILIDEAQDTNPDQWRVVQLLAEEFFAGEGAASRERTIFAVGDAKQSIYSFQRADPEAFEAMRAHFAQRVEAAGRAWRSVALELSFRSAPAILRAVDAVFSRPSAGAGVVLPGTRIHHGAAREGQAGLVELWPPVAPRPRREPVPWAAPLAREAADSPPARLAQLIAARVKRWRDDKEILESRGRPIRAGDVMVLVRRRTVFVEELVRALKSAAVPVAGIDRMVLTEQLAVMDVLALARFLLLPEDDLTLACVLKSPLVGLDEEQLFAVAYDRKGSLWEALAARAAATPAFAAAHAYLAGLLGRADYVRPYELFAEILGSGGAPERPSGRERLLARLGPEAEEPLDELLALALAYERSHAPSLEGFLHWAAAGEAEIKRDPEASARDEVRIMTVHGAKGLQAPIVILPDTLQVPNQAPSLLWSEEGLLWPPRRAHEEGVCQALRAEAVRKRDEEYRRLLYVAMTRAEDRLYLCGWLGERQGAAASWYNLAAEALVEIAEPFAFDCRGELGSAGWEGQGLRLVSPQTAAPARPGAAAAIAEAPPLPDWVRRLPPAEPVPARPLVPSRPSEAEPPVRSPLGPDDGERFRRGLLLHRLLESLPALPPEARAAAAARFLARPGHGLSPAQQADYAREALAVLEEPGFAPLFGPGSRAEVPLTGMVGGVVISGQVDRLVAGEGEVMVVDYKTNRPPPESAAAVAPLYLRQMAAYRALLRAIYPGRAVRCALLWTDGPLLMALPEALLDAHAP